MWRKVTQWVVLFVTAALIVFDLILAFVGEPGSSISSVIRDAAAAHSIVAVAAGILIGHWFWAAKK